MDDFGGLDYWSFIMVPGYARHHIGNINKTMHVRTKFHGTYIYKI